MQIPILKSKLNKPLLPDNWIKREQLCQMLIKSKSEVVIVSSSAGSGKSTLINHWVTSENLDHIWYALDEWDNDMIMFLTYLSRGIERIHKEVGRQLLLLVASFQNIGIDSFTKSLIILLQDLDRDLIIVLDDYHNIENEAINNIVKMLIEYLPERIRLVLITREDPDLALSKLRVSGRLLEIRVSELKFNEQEIKTYLDYSLESNLNDADIDTLTQRTEGWIAGLQLAVLAMKKNKNNSDFINNLSINQYIGDYLIEEVLERQSDEVKTFLLNTSVLDYFSNDLCDALMGRCDTHQIINQLRQENLFLIALDQKQEWFRYHHLFRDFLLDQMKINSNEVESLHKLAAKWYKENDYEREAIHHYLDANAFDEAADMIELAWAKMDMQLQAGTWLELANKLPSVIIEKRPVLSLGYAWALLDTGSVESALKWFSITKNIYSEYLEDLDKFIVRDYEQLTLLPATLASAYGYIAAGTGDLEGLFKYAGEALEKTPEEAYQKRGVIAMLLSVAHWSTGDLKEAESTIQNAMKYIESDINVLTRESFHMVHGELLIQKGQLNYAETVFMRTIKRVKYEGLMMILPSLYLGLAKIEYLKGNNQRAHEYLEISKSHGQHFALMDWQYKYYKLLAMIYTSEALYDLALDCIEESRQYYFMNPIPEYVTLEVIEHEIFLKKGMRQRDLSQFEPFKHDQIPYMIFSKVFVEIREVVKNYDEGELENSLILLNKIEEQSNSNDLMLQKIECGLLKGFVAKRQNDINGYKTLVQESFTLAKENGYRLPFKQLLDKKQYHELYNENEELPSREIANRNLSEPLTMRELEVLGLIVEGLSNKDISSQLFLALSTVKGYIQNIYGKLEVKRRTEAVQKSRTLGLYN